jgi:CRISPR-associated endonuclease/helicase Cas3
MNIGLQRPPYFAYWGKAHPQDEVAQRYHLLVFHSLDVAACGEALLRLPHLSLAALSADLGWPLPEVQRWFVFFLAIHDVGKFARAFQNLAPDLSPDLVPKNPRKQYGERHDTLGWLFWRDKGATHVLGESRGEEDFWDDWMRTAAGHHGKPPRETASSGNRQLYSDDFFLPEDFAAALSFVDAAKALFLPEEMPVFSAEEVRILKQHSWRLAGLAVLADWLGSDSGSFPYQEDPCPIKKYWEQVAQPRAEAAVCAAGLRAQAVRRWDEGDDAFAKLFGDEKRPTPLQQYAATVEMSAEPQLFLLEDVTGAGKTEAALLLAHRLLAAGCAQGLYFALPTMATANQMYERVGGVYRRLYESQANPSLILSHGARQLVEGFRQSVLKPGEQRQDLSYSKDDPSASAQCSAWLADNRKKALLADVGVGTVDQALLGVLPVRHQSLRLLGLSGKVLLIDEVHAYDAYMSTLLEGLLEAQALQGGSAILLSATLPAALRAKLAAAFQRGCGGTSGALAPDMRYPLATQVCGRIEVKTHACATRPQLARRVRVEPLHSEQDVIDLIAREAEAGRSICWIRNTVEDVRHAYDVLQPSLPPERLQLFHSRYAMGDRLAIEGAVVQHFGLSSTTEVRRGQVLIGTQVVEQSLDLDFDVMVSDLAPVDLVIQRAGRLQRHARSAEGNLAADGVERREAPVLHLLCPESTDEPDSNWYKRLFPKASFVYPDAGQLWLTQRVLLEAGCIVTPGESGQRGGVRSLVEAVYDKDAGSPVPEALQRATREQEGKVLAEISLAGFNRLRLDMGYCDDGKNKWFEESQIKTRLGEESRTIYLAREENGTLRPLLNAEHSPWEHSAVRIDARKLNGLAPEWQTRFGAAIEELRKQYRLFADDAFVLPLVSDGDGWFGLCLRDGMVLMVRYDRKWGFGMEQAG